MRAHIAYNDISNNAFNSVNNNQNIPERKLVSHQQHCYQFTNRALIGSNKKFLYLTTWERGRIFQLEGYTPHREQSSLSLSFIIEQWLSDSGSRKERERERGGERERERERESRSQNNETKSSVTQRKIDSRRKKSQPTSSLMGFARVRLKLLFFFLLSFLSAPCLISPCFLRVGIFLRSRYILWKHSYPLKVNK